MTAYLAGGMVLQWLLGPLSDRRGRRPVMLLGALWFILTCLATLLVHDIVTFTVLRFMQGVGLCFIGAVGYAAIQESFDEVRCIKITALMANVALIAPLLGPLAGAAWVAVAPGNGCLCYLRFWHWWLLLGCGALCQKLPPVLVNRFLCLYW